MKKALAMVLALVMCLGLVACAGSGNNSTPRNNEGIYGYAGTCR